MRSSSSTGPIGAVGGQCRRGCLAGQVGDPADLVLAVGAGQASRGQDVDQPDGLLDRLQSFAGLAGIRGQTGGPPVALDTDEGVGRQAVPGVAEVLACLVA